MIDCIEKDFDIKNLTSFKIGGKINEVFFPKSITELINLINKFPNIKILGNLSNTLISSYGYNGKIILTRDMNEIQIEGNKISAMCGVKGPKLSQIACENGLSGLEFMIGFPGSVGGEIYMNASANGQAISDKLISVTCYSLKNKELITYSKDQMEFEYRNSRCERDGLVVLEGKFKLDNKDKDSIKQQMQENLLFRKKHQPSLALPNCGSIFKNPACDSAGRLLDSVGAKEINIGGVKVWRNHANFIVNNNNGSSTDVLELMLELKERVFEKYNINLEPEIKFLGSDNKKENELWQKLNK